MQKNRRPVRPASFVCCLLTVLAVGCTAPDNRGPREGEELDDGWDASSQDDLAPPSKDAPARPDRLSADGGTDADDADVVVAEADAAGDVAIGDVGSTEAGTDSGIAHLPLLKAGLHPDASDRFRAAGLTTAQIGQTIGNAAASGGTHLQDGVANGLPYGAATDLVKLGTDEVKIRELLERLGRLGFAAWFRKPGFDGWPASENPHIHAVYTGCVMKTKLQSQVKSFLIGNNGLIYPGSPYKFYTWSPEAIATVRQMFQVNNP
jgi:hypothetical protein